MKKSILILLVLFTFLSVVNAQDRIKNTFYVNANSGIITSGNRTGFSFSMFDCTGFGVYYLNNERWGLALHSQKHTQDDINAPGDYDSFIGLGPPSTSIKANSLRIVRAFSGLKSKKVRYTVEAGPSYVAQNYPTYTKVYSDYNVDRKNRYGYGLSLKLGRQFMFTKFSSIELALQSNINKHQTFYGFDVNVNIGNLRFSKLKMQ